MRREGFELQVSRPEVLVRQIDGVRHEPRERTMIDVPDEYVGSVTQTLASRRAQVEDMHPGDRGRMIVSANGPARGLIGFRSELMTATRGTALVTQQHEGWMPWAGDIPGRVGGAMISDRSGMATAYALNNLEKRGVLFIGPGDPVYEGMVIGENSRPDEMSANPTKPKQLTNVRASGSDEAINLKPPHRLTLETAIEWIEDDELVEVTPDAIRVRKRYLRDQDRRRAVKTGPQLAAGEPH
ncbi:MAG: translational GTPase TypA, partial [Acidimicrobiia bacterium]